ncbi:MAG: hypothetical protein WCA95_05070 [Opitutaceae bacterium]
MALEKELQTYKRELTSLLANEGQYAVVSGDNVVGVFATYEDALKIAYEKCGINSFLIKKIQSVEQIQYFTRVIDEVCLT